MSNEIAVSDLYSQILTHYCTCALGGCTGALSCTLVLSNGIPGLALFSFSCLFQWAEQSKIVEYDCESPYQSK